MLDDRWEHQVRINYVVEDMRKEFRDRLYVNPPKETVQPPIPVPHDYTLIVADYRYVDSINSRDKYLDGLDYVIKYDDFGNEYWESWVLFVSFGL